MADLWPAVAAGHILCELVALGILAARLSGPGLASLVERLNVPRNQAVLLEEILHVHRLLPELSQELSGSALARLLRPYSEGALFAAWVMADTPRAREQIVRYQRELRHIRPGIDGHGLRALGVQPGPAYARILEALRDARLDGLISTPAEEEALLHRLLEGQS